MFNLNVSIPDTISKKQSLTEGIHIVTLKNVTKETIKTKDGSEKECVKILFENKDGVYEHTIWPLTEADGTRKTGQFGENPSGFEQLMASLKQILKAVNPKGLDVLKEGVSFNTWEDVRNFIIGSLLSGVNNECKIKLLGSDTTTLINGVKVPKYSNFPSFTLGINKEGILYTTTTFIGTPVDKIEFNKKELTKINARTEATSDLGNLGMDLDLGL